MSRKIISVSVPEDLYQKIEKYKDSFNYSGLFQDVVSKEIQKKEDFQNRLKGDANMNEIIERLKSEKTESETEYFDQGKTEGLEWAKASHYEEIQVSLNFSLEWQKGMSPFEFFNDDSCYAESWEEYWNGILEENKGLNITGNGETNYNLDSFISGWIEGIKEFWKEVSSKI